MAIPSWNPKLMEANQIRKYSVCKLPSNCKLGGNKPRIESFQRFTPKEYKLGSDRITPDDFSHKALYGKLKVQTFADTGKDESKWINELYEGKISYGKLIQAIQSQGFTEEEAKEILDEAIYHSERSSDWALANEKYGGIAANSALVAACLGVLKTVVEGSESTPPFIKNVIGILHGGACASRGYFQYGYVYGRKIDDEKAKNNYEGEFYGNTLSSTFADLAYIFESKINLIPLPLLGLTSEETQKTISSLLSLMNILWWRVRMLAEVRQDFSSDLFTYLIHKPLALIGINESINKVRKIKEKGHLTYPYVQKRLIELIGLDPIKHKLKDIFPELARLLKDVLGSSKKDANHASHKVGKFLAPFFGFYGFVAFAIGAPLKSILKWLNLESKYINALASSSIASQQLLYLFRMILPEQLENRLTKNGEENHEIKELKSERDRLFYTGVTNCSLSIVSSILKLANIENKYLKIGEGVLDELLDKGIQHYFSKRRELRGKKFRLDNPELFNSNGTPKIISSKIKKQNEQEQTSVSVKT